jgi:predicted MFS family arabinose efflux permease
MTSQRGLAATLTVAMAVATFLQFALGALGPFITEDLEISRTQLGALTTALYGVGGALSPVGGPLADRFGGRRTLLALCVAAGCSALLGAAAPTYLLLALAVGVGGIALSVVNPATNKLLAQYVDPSRQGVVTGVKQSGVQIGAFVAGVTLPPIAGVLGWRSAMAMSAALAAGCALAALAVVPAHEARQHEVRLGGGGRLGPAVNRLAVYALLMGAGAGAASVFLPLYGVERLDLTKSVAGQVASLLGLAGVVGRLLLGRAADRSRTPVTVTLGWLAVAGIGATLLLMAAESAGAWLLWVGAAAFGATAVAWNTLGMLSIVRGVEHHLAGRASGRVLLGFYGGFVVGPVAFGWSVDEAGSYVPGWLGVCGSFVLAAVVALSWHRARLRSAPAHRPADQAAPT